MGGRGSGSGPVSIAELAIRNGTFTWTLSVAILILGWLGFENLPRLEDPEISIREARIITPYPGASAAEVELEVSDRIERAVKGHGQLRRVESYSSRGLSVVRVVIRDGYDNQTLPRVWSELRYRIADIQPELPPVAGPSTVENDLGAVYGFYYALVGEGFTLAELGRVAELLQQELSTLGGVRKAILFGERQETVYVEVSGAKAKALGTSRDRILAALRSKGLAADAGHIRVGPEQVAIHPGGLYRSEQDLGDLMIAAGQDRLIRLGDLAEIRRGFDEPPRRLLRVDGRPAIGVAVSAMPASNLIALGEAVERRLAELTVQIPLGMELKVISLQSEAVARAIDGGVYRLVQALALVMVALLLFMGLRVGLVVGLHTLLTLAATFLVMDWLQLTLDRVSLGALTMASGLIPGNAILVVDGMKQRLDQGLAGIAAAREAVAENAVPLLGSTAAVVLAFTAIGGMDNGTGEQLRALALVVPIALPIGWLAALWVAPLLANQLLVSGVAGIGSAAPYDGRFFRLYARMLATAIRHRWVVLGATALLVALSIHGLGFVRQTFFAPSSKPGFLVEVHFREGTHIRETERRMDEIQAYLRGHEGIVRVATAIGAGHPGYPPIYETGSDVGGHYGLSLVSVGDERRIDALVRRIQTDLDERFPDALVNVRRHARVPATAGGRIQLRIGGPDPAELRRLADRVKAVISSDPDAKAVRDDWGAKVKVARPVLARETARRMGIDRSRISDALRTTYSGAVAGHFREGAGLIPIVVRAPREERSKVEDMAEVQVTSPLRGDEVSMRQLVERLDTIAEDARRSRRDGLRTITVHADANQGLSFDLLERIKPRVEKALEVDLAAYAARDPGWDFGIGFDTIPMVPDDKIPLRGKPGYFIAWGGEAEDAAESRAELLAWIPICSGLLLLVLVALFNRLHQPLIVLLTMPLAMVGVTAGLLLTGRPFDFLSLFGVLALSGILMGNAILLVVGLDQEMGAGKVRPATIRHAGSSRLRPVGLAAGVSILGMVPLLGDDLFASMAVTIMSGLGIATLLSLVLVPLLYAVLFPVRSDE